MRKDYQTIGGLDAETLAVSDNQLSGAERAINHLDLGFPVLFDPEAVVIERFDVYGTLNDGYATPSVSLSTRTATYAGSTKAVTTMTAQPISKSSPS